MARTNLPKRDTSYRNNRMLNADNGGNPGHLGRLLYFTKDETTFGRFALKVLLANPNLQDLKAISVDYVSAIFTGFKGMIPNLRRLVCVRQLIKCDEMKLSELLPKTLRNIADRNRTSSEINRYLRFKNRKLLRIKSCRGFVPGWLEGKVRDTKGTLGITSPCFFPIGLVGIGNHSSLKVSFSPHELVQIPKEFITKMTLNRYMRLKRENRISKKTKISNIQSIIKREEKRKLVQYMAQATMFSYRNLWRTT